MSAQSFKDLPDRIPVQAGVDDSVSPPTAEWPLDPNSLADIAALAQGLPSLPVVCSDMRRAIETAKFFGVPTIDPRLAEVARPFVDDPQEAFAGYLSGQAVDGWEPQANAIARMEASVVEHGEAIYVTHGTVLSLFIRSQCPDLDARSFWTDLRNPDAWSVQQAKPLRLG